MSDKKALIVIDMQNDYLWPERKKKFSYDTDTLVGNVNAAIHAFQKKGHDVIYIAQMFANIPTNRWFIGFSIEGTEGTKLYDGVDVVSDLYFEKRLPDTYSSKAFREHMEREQYSEVYLCGLDECGCVGATAKGAVKTGVTVKMIRDCIGRRFPDKKVQKKRRRLRAMGVKYISMNRSREEKKTEG
jgi:nicotinamidase-related amidase